MSIDVAGFKNNLLTLLPEAFGVSDAPNGYMLDDGHAGLLGTLEQVDAATASAGLRPQNATVAAHTNHILLLLDLFVAYDHGEQPQADWEGSWKVQQVDAAAWDALRARVRAQYEVAIERIQERTEWPPEAVGGAIILLTHVSYHLGEIKQLLTSLQK
jgi:hypothetical protein